MDLAAQGCALGSCWPPCWHWPDLAFSRPARTPRRPYSFNEPTARALGDEEIVFEALDDNTFQLKDQCSNDPVDADIPDSPARAYRNSSGQIVLFSSHFYTRRFIGPSFNSLTHPCDVVMAPGSSDAPAAFNDKEWINATYTTDGNTVYALIHEEFQGWRYDPQNCQIDLNNDGAVDFDDHQRCWRNSITLATSTNGGATFTSPGCLTQPTPPCNLIAGSPYQFNSSPAIGPYGYFNPSNIIKHENGATADGRFYFVVRSLGTSHTPDHPSGICLVRTKTNQASSLADPTAWEAWGGSSFNVTFVNPYPSEPANKAPHSCKAVDPDLATMSGSLTYSSYFGKYVIVDRLAGSRTPGVYMSKSDDLINWSPPELIMRAEVPPLSGVDCNAPHPVRLPSLIDHTSGTRNFETTGRRPYLYYTRAIMDPPGGSSCHLDLDRDLVRIPIEFNASSPPVDPPPDGGGDPPPPDDGGQADTSAATVSLRAGKRQDIDKLSVSVTLNESASVVATATVNVPGASKVHKFKRVSKSVAANKRTKFNLKLSKKSLRTAKRALKRRKKLTAKVRVVATDGGGNKSSKRSSIRLKR